MLFTPKEKIIKYVEVRPNSYSGLGNRIKCLVSGMLIADKLNAKILLNWNKSKGCNCSFKELFENEFYLINDTFLFSFLRKFKFLRKNNLNTISMNTWRLLLFSDISKYYGNMKVLKEDIIDFKYEKIPISKRVEILKYLSQLKPKKNIKDEAERFSKKISENTIYFAIRSWADCPTKKRKNFQFRRIFKIMDLFPSSNFYISCDSDEVLKKIVDKYGSRILYYPHKATIGDRNSKKGIQEALIEILILSKSKKIFATKSSTFSEVAWWFGGCKAKVFIIEDYFNNQFNNYI
ncbi:hypothetical protein KY334_00035 [Candidatus Woesearchaeota archaeon]|nr:hypothetical protein [Candidatus Woesearchaeota archaeon]